jgi:hypothetical protein
MLKKRIERASSASVEPGRGQENQKAGKSCFSHDRPTRVDRSRFSAVGRALLQRLDLLLMVAQAAEHVAAYPAHASADP